MGPDFLVNTCTQGDQAHSTITVGDGGFVVAWQAGYSSCHGIFAQRYDNMGIPQGTEFRIDSEDYLGSELPNVGGDSAGNFVVVWQHLPEPSGRRFDATGAPLGVEFQLNTYTILFQGTPDVGVAPDGDFVAVWASWGQDGSGAGVFGQRFDSNGSPQGDEFQVNTLTLGAQEIPAVAASASGFVVVWRSSIESDTDFRIFGQRYDDAGIRQGEEFQVDEGGTPGFNPGFNPKVAEASSGDFVVVWNRQAGAVFARRYDAAGQPEGDELHVNTLSGGFPDVALDGSGNFISVWTTYVIDGPKGIFGRLYDSTGAALGDEFRISSESAAPGPRVGSDSNGNFVVTWVSDTDGSGTAVRARRGSISAAQSMALDVHAGDGSNLNGIIEPGETVMIEPTWRNTFTAPLALTGIASNLTGPPGPRYELVDGASDYGAVSPGETADCFDATASHDCYKVTISGARPALHWDATLDESLTNGFTKTWSLHLGESFSDVSPSHPFYAYVEHVLHNEITAGCGGGAYCPDGSVTRAQMAVFLLKSKHGYGYTPPTCLGVFQDVKCPGLFADWIEELAAEGITGGCGGGNYCPSTPVTRAQMSAFLLKAKHGSSYVPPACTGVFGDVACPSLFADWIEQLAAEQITGGCGGGNFCPDNPNTRAQMSAFLVKTFGM